MNPLPPVAENIDKKKKLDCKEVIICQEEIERVLREWDQ